MSLHVAKVALLCALSLSLGCEGLLGLDGVTYRQPAVGGQGGVASGGGGAGGGSAGGSPLVGVPQWAKRIGGGELQQGLGVVFLDDGEILVTGLNRGSVTFRGSTYTNVGSQPDLLVASYSALGAELWARGFGGSKALLGFPAARGTGALIAGRYDGGTVNPGGGDLPDPTPMMGVANNDAMFIKYDDEGDFRWAVTAGALEADEAWCAASHGVDEVFLGGAFSDGASFGGNTLTSTGGLDGVVAKLSDGGTAASYVWTATLGAVATDDRVRDMAVTSGGDVVAVTHAVLAGVAENAAGVIEVHRLAGSDGAAVWGPVVFSGPLQLGGIAVDASDHTLVYAAFSTSVATSLGDHQAIGAIDLMLARIDAAGELLWVKQFPASTTARARGVATHGDSSIVISGSLRDSLSIGDHTIASSGGLDAFVAKLDPEGGVMWAHPFGDPVALSDTFATDCDVSPSGEVVLVGAMRGQIDFGSNILTAVDDFDMFVVKIGP
jgi:hypothetical protein